MTDMAPPNRPQSHDAARMSELLSAEAYLRSQATAKNWPRLEEIADLMAAARDSFDLGVREGWQRSTHQLVCSWCGEDYEGDPEFTASGCCSCDLVPASSLPSIIQGLRRELAAAEERLGKVEDALA